MEPSQNNLLERINKWLEQSITVKLASIGFLVLILLIPSAWVMSIMEERQERATSVIDEVADSWSGAQQLTGPVLVIPYTYFQKVVKDNKTTELVEQKSNAYFLPEQLNVKGTVNPELLHRGIFDAVVYRTNLDITASFAQPTFEGWNADSIHWHEARLVYGIEDLRGISDKDPVITFGGQSLNPAQSTDLGIQTGTFRTTLSHGIAAKISGLSPERFNGSVSISLTLKGSEHLFFTPVGQTTIVDLEGPWGDPSFGGEFLPESRDIQPDKFSAHWKILRFNRPFDDRWNTENKSLSGADFGVTLLAPVDQYQKSIRTSKYSVLIILLTFIALFLVEISQRVKIHPFQYILIGVALIVYYTLLLSIAEQVGFTASYWISAIATLLLISAYSTSFFPRKGLSILLASLLTVFYLFIYIIVIQQDFSLLIGSIGLFIVTGLLMYFSRKIKWYKE